MHLFIRRAANTYSIKLARPNEQRTSACVRAPRWSGAADG